MKHEIKRLPGKGRVLWLTDEKTEVGLALDYGIRIVHLSCKGLENLLYEQPADLSDGLTTEKGWRIFGGHRLWTAPESDMSYYPDHEPVTYALTENGAVLTQNIDPWLETKKQLQIEYCEDGSLLLRHRVENISNEIRPYASWGVTTFDKGNAWVLFHRGTPGSYNPERILALWGDSCLSDPRICFECDRIQATHILMDNSFKMGVFSPEGRAQLTNKGQCFTLSFEADPRGNYPDGGCNFELYLDRCVLELEALGQVKPLAPGEAAEHWERWQVEKL